MKIERLPYDLTVCKVRDISSIDLTKEFCFIGKTGEEISLVCLTSDVPADTVASEEGWKAMRISGELDFSLIGILSKFSSILAGNGIGIFAVSTYNTDYILVKEENYDKALNALLKEGYEIG